MAYLFALWVQCKEPAQALAIDKYFEGMTRTLADGTVTTCHVTRPVLGCDSCCWILPTNISRTGVASEADAKQLSELGTILYDRLKTAPSFLFALVGVEFDDVRTEADVKDILRDASRAYRGIVVSLKNWREAGEPPGFERFRPGYMWRPYQGEAWPPL